MPGPITAHAEAGRVVVSLGIGGEGTAVAALVCLTNEEVEDLISDLDDAFNAAAAWSAQQDAADAQGEDRAEQLLIDLTDEPDPRREP